MTSPLLRNVSALAEQMKGLARQAHTEYSAEVDAVIRSQSCDIQRIERMLDPQSWNSKQLTAEFKEYKSKYSTSQRARCSYDYVAYLDRLKNFRTHQPAEGKS